MVLPKDANSKVLRDFFEQQKAQVCSLADCLEEPWKTHFNNLKAEYDNVLKDLPPSDQAPAALDANRHLNVFASLLCGANSLCSMLSSHMDSMRRERSAGFASAVEGALKERIGKGELVPAAEIDSRVKTGLDTAVGAEVKRRTEAGELVPKETTTQLCSQARQAGVDEGRTAMKTEMETAAATATRITTRKASLQTAGLPLPDGALENLLGGPDAEYTALETTVKSRIEGLKGKGVAFNSKNPVYAKVWLPENEWKSFEALVSDIPALKGGAEPLAGGGGGSGSGSGGGKLPPVGIY